LPFPPCCGVRSCRHRASGRFASARSRLEAAFSSCMAARRGHHSPPSRRTGRLDRTPADLARHRGNPYAGALCCADDREPGTRGGCLIAACRGVAPRPRVSVLADTSIWVEYLRGQEPVASQLRAPRARGASTRLRPRARRALRRRAKRLRCRRAISSSASFAERCPSSSSRRPCENVRRAWLPGQGGGSR
jgi:hypothetical protein